MAFADLFTFTRSAAAPYRDGAGLVQTAAIDRPRFDHDVEGRPLGLLVEPGLVLGMADRARAIGGDWAAPVPATVLHEWSDGSDIRADAHYSTNPLATVNGCLAIAGHHRRIAVFPGFFRNLDGVVYVLGQRWMLPGMIGDPAGEAIATGDQPLLAT